MKRAALALALAVCIARAVSAGAASECAPQVGSVRVMLHDPDVLAGRLSLLAKAPETRTGRVDALRTLFAAAGCSQISELGDERGRNIECTVPGDRDGVIVVGASQEFDSLGTLAMLPSLAEALAVAPRSHTFRFVAFSAHDSVRNGEREQRPKGAMRILDALSAADRAKVDVMIHIGPIGFGPIREHPAGADARLRCSLEHAARSAGIELGAPQPSESECEVKRYAGPGSRLPGSASMIACPKTNLSHGAIDWQPFRRAGIPIFGVHSSDPLRSSAKLDTALYLQSYRALVIFLALADEVLLATAPPAEQPPSGAATSLR
jgi:hypothetical protein